MTGAAAAIDAVGVRKAFGDIVAIADAGVRVERGQLAALLGPSGSGKTTLLRTIAGFEVPDAGTISIGGRVVAADGVFEEPERRRIGMVFQEAALFPHMTVGKNVGFGDASAARVRECLDLVGLADRATAYPHELSGGEGQRVALARALAPSPEVILLDEPFASLDKRLRESLREEVAEILRTAGASALLVTHDQEEALSLADVVAVMRDGRIVQSGRPEEVYGHPASRWVAEFLGEAEVLPGTAVEGIAECELGRFPADRRLGGAVELVFRPESLTIGGADAPGDAPWARVRSTSFFGHDQLVRLELESGQQLQSRRLGFGPWHPGDEVRVWIDGPVHVVPAESAAAGNGAHDDTVAAGVGAG